MKEPVKTKHQYYESINRILNLDSRYRFFLKEERLQPARSIKSRVAYAMVRKSLLIGKPIAESSSGNLVLGLCFWAQQLQAPPPLCIIDECCDTLMVEALTEAGCGLEMMPLSARERELQTGVDKRVKRVKELAEKGYYWPNQYDNNDWVRVHQQTTGPEIWSDTQKFDVVAVAIGTGATISGIACSKPSGNPTRILAVEPEGSTITGSSRGPYKIAGAGNSFIPKNYLGTGVDSVILIPDDRVFPLIGTLRKSGIRIGSSGTLALVGAADYARKKLPQGGNILVLIADDGWYEDIPS